MTVRPVPSVLIIGGGPAGLTAAHLLARRGFHVTILDQATTLGGSLASIHAPFIPILGCHRATWMLLRSLSSAGEIRLFHDVNLEFRLTDDRIVPYPRSRLPQPFHVMSSVGRFAGFSWSERWRLLSWLEQIWEDALELTGDLEHRTAQDWLNSLGFGHPSTRSIWHPLSSWLTGNNLRILSADALVTACIPFFLRKASDRRIAVLRDPWDRLLVQPIADAIRQTGGIISLRTRAGQILSEHNRVTGVRVEDGSIRQADWYITALPHQQLTPLLPERWLSRYAYFQQITELRTLPGRLVHVHIHRPLTSARLILLQDEPFAWVWGRAIGPQDSLFSCMVVNGTPWTGNVENEAVSVLRALGFVEAPSSIASVEQDHRPDSFLSLHPGTKTRRPISQGPIANFLLAGAWTDTGWPANLESAIESGVRCAEIIGNRIPS